MSDIDSAYEEYDETIRKANLLFKESTKKQRVLLKKTRYNARKKLERVIDSLK